MRIFTGTSGWSYKSWGGEFYPRDLRSEGFLGYYATRLAAVEVNNTFYRMPKRAVLESWAAEVPESFRFVLKISRRVSHFKRLKGCGELMEFILGNAALLAERLGPLLLQLPPDFKADLPLLRGFFRELPRGFRVALEPRHRSWLCDELVALFAELNAEVPRVGFCGGGRLPNAALDDLADVSAMGYLRLREGSYTDEELSAWKSWLEARPWDEAYVFFKHDDAAQGPLLAERFAEAGRPTSGR